VSHLRFPRAQGLRQRGDRLQGQRLLQDGQPVGRSGQAGIHRRCRHGVVRLGQFGQLGQIGVGRNHAGGYALGRRILQAGTQGVDDDEARSFNADEDGNIILKGWEAIDCYNIDPTPLYRPSPPRT